MKKKVIAILMSVVCAAGLMACGGAKEMISVVSREEGSGTRGAFVELMGVEDDNGDNTTEEAIIATSTEVVMTTVNGDEFAIGYTSLGALNDSVKAIAVDGVEATIENVKNGSYAVSRPFNIATLGEKSEVTEDFIRFILSADGQAVIEDKGYIAVSEEGAFETSGAEGKIVIDGSSSVAPVMEKLVEAYLAVNTNATIELQQSDSSTGMQSAIDGTIDICTASRNLKDSELEAGLEPVTIAIDGIAVIVNKDNEVENLSAETIRQIYVGEITDWSEVKE